MDNQTASTIFGILGAVCWSIQLAPQIILNYRRHSAAGLSAPFMLLWACAGIPLGVYNIVADLGIALVVQPQVLTSLSLVTLGQCVYYERAWSLQKALAVLLLAASAMGGIEIGLVFALKTGRKQGIEWPLTLMAVLAATLLALGVLEQYIAIWRNKSVQGISFLFCGLDAMGDVTSIISVVLRRRLDILGLIAYGVELVLWIGIFALGFYFKLLPWLAREFRGRGRGTLDPGVNAGMRPEDTQLAALSDMPSSTSVFRTPAEETELRQRRAHK